MSLPDVNETINKLRGRLTPQERLQTELRAADLLEDLSGRLLNDDTELLRELVDLTWNHAFENSSVPATSTIDWLIENARANIAARRKAK